MSDPKPSDPPQLPDHAADKLIAAIKAMPASKAEQPKPSKGDDS
jgi:hypothetical protein